MTATTARAEYMGWVGIARLGIVQAALGAIVVLTTSTLNRVMVVELALPAMLPGALVALHYGVQILRPRWGHGSDCGGRRTPWIIAGMAVLALGAVTAAGATALLAANTTAGIVLSVVGFVLIGIGVGACGTTLLALLAVQVEPKRRPAAATIVWMTMIAGMVLTASVAGGYLDPYSHARLVAVTAIVAALALTATVLAVWGIERRTASRVAVADAPAGDGGAFMDALRSTWADPAARRFAIFVFVSMLAYSAQDLILEPFAGLVFGLTPGESTRLAGVQHGGVFIGMLVVAIAGSAIGGRVLGSLKMWTIGGCMASAAALFALAVSGFVSAGWPLRETVFTLGVANGVFAVAAIGSMMGLAGAGGEKREGIRMGVWGAAQAIAFGLGGFLGTVMVDVARALIGTPSVSYAVVFAAEGAMFVFAAVLARNIGRAERATAATEHTIVPGAAAPVLPGE